MFSQHPLDWALVLAYFAAIVAVWWRLGRAPSTATEYLVAGRRVTLPALVATLVSTWYGGILGVGEFTWSYGISNWLVFGVPYYIGALLFAWLFARRAREAELYTIPDLLQRRYGRSVALIGAVAVFVTAAPAAYVLILGTLFSAMTGASLVLCTVAAALFSVFYVHRGGLRGVLLTDVFQFVLMFGGFAMLLGFLVAAHGGPGFLAERLPEAHLTWHGGNPVGAIVVWYFIALGALVEPAFWQRAFAARDAKIARRGVLVSVGFWMVFDAMTTSAGLYARALLPELAQPVFAFPELARVALPPVALGLFYVGLIATVMSTIDSYAFVAAATIGRDVLWRLRGEASEAKIATYTRVGLWITAAWAVALALAQQSVIGLWHDLGSIVTPMLLIPVGTALIGRATLPARWTLVAMLAPMLAVVAWLTSGKWFGDGTYPLSIRPIYVGLAISLGVYACGWLFQNSRAPGDVPGA